MLALTEEEVKKKTKANSNSPSGDHCTRWNAAGTPEHCEHDLWLIHGRKVEGDTINETQVYLEGGARNLQVGIKEVTSYKTKPQKNKKKMVIWIRP